MVNELREIPIPEKKAKCQLTGEDGNMFFIMTRASTAMKQAGYSALLVEQYQQEILSARDYSTALMITTDYVDDVWQDDIDVNEESEGL